VHARREQHHGALVEDDLPLEAELADHLDGRDLIRLARRHDHPAGVQRGSAALAQPLRQGGRGWFRHARLLARLRPVEPTAGCGPVYNVHDRPPVRSCFGSCSVGGDRIGCGRAASNDRRGWVLPSISPQKLETCPRLTRVLQSLRWRTMEEKKLELKLPVFVLEDAVLLPGAVARLDTDANGAALARAAAASEDKRVVVALSTESELGVHPMATLARVEAGGRDGGA